mmetsp:Transcript_105598/g.298932  ORF Transcript_105598/g.298932 Transcript_105598/m.298932 type:complete len:278 (+) Transcript_105598:554-1387(+)
MSPSTDSERWSAPPASSALRGRRSRTRMTSPRVATSLRRALPASSPGPLREHRDLLLCDEASHQDRPSSSAGAASTAKETGPAAPRAHRPPPARERLRSPRPSSPSCAEASAGTGALLLDAHAPLAASPAAASISALHPEGPVPGSPGSPPIGTRRSMSTGRRYRSLSDPSWPWTSHGRAELRCTIRKRMNSRLCDSSSLSITCAVSAPTAPSARPRARQSSPSSAARRHCGSLWGSRASSSCMPQRATCCRAGADAAARGAAAAARWTSAFTQSAR